MLNNSNHKSYELFFNLIFKNQRILENLKIRPTETKIKIISKKYILLKLLHLRK